MNTCSVPGCHRPVRSNDMCNTHDWRAWAGKPLDAPIKMYARTDEERFKMYVEPTGFCWNRTGPVRSQDDQRGRITLKAPRRQVYAYRWVYEKLVGPVPEGLVLDHLCRNPNCVNPDHLEPVTNRQNVRRGLRAGLGSCRKGLHRLEGDNVYINPSSGRRSCRACRTEARRLCYWNQKGASHA